jgi:hypothetical protein
MSYEDSYTFFLTIQESHVYFIHQSAKEYLTDKAADKIYSAGKGPIHFDIFTQSLAAMSGTLKQDIYKLGRPEILVKDIMPPHPDPLAAVRYSCIYWIDHLLSSSNKTPNYQNELSDNGAIFDFFKKHFLYWLEGLSLFHSFSSSILSIRRLRDALQVYLQRFYVDKFTNNCSRHLIRDLTLVHSWEMLKDLY